MESQDPGPPQLTLEGAVATIEFRRPRQANRVEPGDLDVLHRHLEKVEGNSALRVLVFRGRGKHFSAGYTIQALPGGEGRSRGGDGFERLVNRIEDLAVVTIAALNGGVYGGSTDLALACDFRIGVTVAEMVMPAARLGLHYYERGLYRYTPGGAFYVLVDISAAAMDSRDFAVRLLKEKRVAVAPGSTFGRLSAAAVRVSIASRDEDVREGLKRICDFIDERKAERSL